MCMIPFNTNPPLMTRRISLTNQNGAWDVPASIRAANGSLGYSLQLKVADLDIKKRNFTRFHCWRFSVHKIQVAASVGRTSDVTKRSGKEGERSQFDSFCLAVTHSVILQK